MMATAMLGSGLCVGSYSILARHRAWFPKRRARSKNLSHTSERLQSLPPNIALSETFAPGYPQEASFYFILWHLSRPRCAALYLGLRLSEGSAALALERSHSVTVSGGAAKLGRTRSRGDCAKPAFGVHIRPLRESAGRRMMQKVGDIKGSSWL